MSKAVFFDSKKFQLEFIGSFFLKLGFIFLFSSEVSIGLFQPFLNSVSLENINPWQTSYEAGALDAFPYHGFMLYVMWPFASLAHEFGITPLFHIPLVLADIGILLVLLKFFPTKSKQVLIYYFLNPILIYATYIHFQLDIIPTALMFAASYFLVKDKKYISSLFFGLALASKSYVLVVFPLILFYLYKKSTKVSVLKYAVISIVVALVLDTPFISSPGFINMVLLNPKQAMIFDTFYAIGSLKLLLPVSIILLIYFHFFNQRKINRDLLLFYFGLLFVAIIFLIYPAPGWYVWAIPFISAYFIQSDNQQKTLLLYSFVSLAYLVFFIMFYEGEYQQIFFLGSPISFKVHNTNLANISFTVLESSLLAILYAFYKYGIKSNSIYKMRKNLCIGIGGDSGVGKSTLLKSLEKVLGSKMLQIEGDGEHKWERGDTRWTQFTHLDPKANYIHEQAEAIHQLKNNQTIYRREYDHSTGKFTEPLKVLPKEYIIIAGLHPFYLPKLRKSIDLKIYLDVDEGLRRYWKIRRDTQKRGYSIEKILDQIERRMDDARRYIYPQRTFADVIIHFFPIRPINNDFSTQHLSDVEIGLKITFDANVHIEHILGELGGNILWDYNNDLKSQYIQLDKQPSINFYELAIRTIDNIDEIVTTSPIWENGYRGFIQYIILMMISEKMKEVS